MNFLENAIFFLEQLQFLRNFNSLLVVYFSGGLRAYTSDVGQRISMWGLGRVPQKWNLNLNIISCEITVFVIVFIHFL